MSNRARTAAFAAALALGVWFAAAAESISADEKGGKVGPYNTALVDLTKGKGKPADIANKADLGDVMQAFKPRAKGGLGVGPTPDTIKPDGIELKFIALGKMKAIPAAALGKEGPDIAKAADVTKAIAGVTLLYAEKEGKKAPTKWKQFAEDMQKAAGDLSAAAKKGDPAAVKTAIGKLNASCNDCHADFRD
jgi:hypothetical protein